MKWPEYRLDELGHVSRGRSRHRPRDAAHLYGGPYPFVQTGDVKHSDLYIRTFTQTYSEAGLAQSRLWPIGSLCITIAANIADTAILAIDACFPDSVIGFIPDDRKADARFIKYLFDAILQRNYKTFTQGAAQDNLSQSKLLSIKLAVPDVTIQTRIADILSAYDDLIENNKRRMQLLEEAARQLYREWFVRLRFPGHEHTKITNGLPEGWVRKPLGELCAAIKDTVLPDQVDSDTPYIGLEHMPRRSISLCEWGKADDVASMKFRFIEGDILFGKIRPYFHKVGTTFTSGITSSDAIVVRSNDSDLQPLLLCLMSSDEFVADTAQSRKEGSKMPRADWKLMQQFPVVFPSGPLLNEFSSCIKSIAGQLKTLTLQNQKLRAARDLLLPKLMNGEIEV